MQHISKYTLALIARVPRNQLLNSRSYLIDIYGMETWNTLLELNASYENKLKYGVSHIQSGFTLRQPPR